ncbi:MAG: glycosyltransferase family 2 protein [Planctomycetota bacterium]
MNEQKIPELSVLMAAYNAERYVAETLRSVLSQTYEDFELVIVDDGSTDGTAQILEAFATSDPRVRVITGPNAGVPQAANVGLAACRGEFVARIDADDIAKPRRFEVQLQYMKDHDLVACGTWHDFIDEHGRLLKLLETPVDDATIQDMALRGHGSICNPTSMFRRQALVDLGGYSEDMPVAEDLDCWLRLGEVGKLGNVPECLGQYRLHSTSISERKCIAQREHARIACERAWERRGIQCVFEAASPWRPGEDRDSRHHFAMEYGWWAFKSKQFKTAAAYGWRSVKLKPWNLAGYKLVMASLTNGGMKNAPTGDDLPTGQGVPA